MTNDTLTIRYSPVSPGTDRTEILFYGPDSAAELADCLSPGKHDAPRIFVTDTTVASLPLMAGIAEAFGLAPGVPAEEGGVFRSGSDTLIALGPGESRKTVDNVLAIIKAALDSGLRRSSVFVGIGGGVICDMTAFAASIFKRGARLELVPTTLLSMVDAAVGGKTGCDFDTYKNMIGTFYPAERLHVFSGFVQLLPESEFRSGLAETLKTAMLYAPKLFDIMQNQGEAVKRRDPETIRQLIRRCVIAKANIVEKDLTETGLRMQLNLGHTFAHALESRAGLGAVPHGDAVAWGIGRAVELSVRLGLCGTDYRNEVFGVLESYGWETSPVHPVLAPGGQDADRTAEALISAMRKDKKNTSDSIRCILQREMNSTVIQEVPEADIAAVLGA